MENKKKWWAGAKITKKHLDHWCKNIRMKIFTELSLFFFFLQLQHNDVKAETCWVTHCVWILSDRVQKSERYWIVTLLNEAKKRKKEETLKNMAKHYTVLQILNLKLPSVLKALNDMVELGNIFTGYWALSGSCAVKWSVPRGPLRRHHLAGRFFLRGPELD